MLEGSGISFVTECIVRVELVLHGLYVQQAWEHLCWENSDWSLLAFEFSL